MSAARHVPVRTESASGPEPCVERGCCVYTFTMQNTHPAGRPHRNQSLFSDHYLNENVVLHRDDANTLYESEVVGSASRVFDLSRLEVEGLPVGVSFSSRQESEGVGANVEAIASVANAVSVRKVAVLCNPQKKPASRSVRRLLPLLHTAPTLLRKVGPSRGLL